MGLKTKQSLLQQFHRKTVEPRLHKMYLPITIDVNIFREAMRVVVLIGCTPRVERHWVLLRDSTVTLPTLPGRIEVIQNLDDDSGRSSRSDTSDEDEDPQLVHGPVDIVEIKAIKRAMSYVRETLFPEKRADLGEVWSLFQRAEFFRSTIILPV